MKILIEKFQKEEGTSPLKSIGVVEVIKCKDYSGVIDIDGILYDVSELITALKVLGFDSFFPR